MGIGLDVGSFEGPGVDVGLGLGVDVGVLDGIGANVSVAANEGVDVNMGSDVSSLEQVLCAFASSSVSYSTQQGSGQHAASTSGELDASKVSSQNCSMLL